MGTSRPLSLSHPIPSPYLLHHLGRPLASMPSPSISVRSNPRTIATSRSQMKCRASDSQSQLSATEGQKITNAVMAEPLSQNFFPRVSRSLDSVKVFDLEGNCIPVADLWKDRRVVIGFTRHFGCVLCMKRANLLASRKDEINEANASLIVIGPGNVEQAREFAKNMKFPGEVYADPNFATHVALEFVSGIGSTISLTTGLRIIAAYREGYQQDWNLSSDKDTMSRGGWQQGGVLVAGPGKENIIYLFKDIQAGDEPDMDELVAACQK